jgi:hypothetical protein
MTNGLERGRRVRRFESGAPRGCGRAADLEIGDTAGLETCATNGEICSSRRKEVLTRMGVSCRKKCNLLPSVATRIYEMRGLRVMGIVSEGSIR